MRIRGARWVRTLAVAALFLTSGLSGCGPRAPRPAAVRAAVSDPVEGWLKRTSIPLATTDPQAPADDLGRLDSFVQGRTVVAVGEATHGTREFFQLKHRIFRYLAERHGFRWFTIEMPHAAAARIDAWIAGGEGRPEPLLQGSYWWVDSREILELVLWMRRFNEGVDEPHRVHFFGFDTQKPEASEQALVAFLAKADPDAKPADLLRDRERLPDALRTMADRVRAAGATAYEAALADAAVLAENARMQRSCHGKAGCLAVLRDGFMAENLQGIAAIPDRKVFAWAHNGHVAHVEHADGWRSMGSYLREALGDRYVAVGFEYERGSFIAPAGGWGQTTRTRRLAHLGGRLVAEYTTPAPPDDALVRWLARVGHDLYFLPLAGAAAVPEVRSLFDQTRKLHEYGAGVPSQEGHFASQDRVPDAFDALLFVRETHGYAFGAD